MQNVPHKRVFYFYFIFFLRFYELWRGTTHFCVCVCACRADGENKYIFLLLFPPCDCRNNIVPFRYTPLTTHIRQPVVHTYIFGERHSAIVIKNTYTSIHTCLCGIFSFIVWFIYHLWFTLNFASIVYILPIIDCVGAGRRGWGAVDASDTSISRVSSSLSHVCVRRNTKWSII